MKIAVTGASGHVGNVLCRELIQRGFKIRALVHKNTDDLQEMGAEIVNGDILDKQSLVRLFSGADMVFHLAAKIAIDKKEKDLVNKTNIDGTQNVIDVCKEQNIRRLVHFSTIHTFQVDSSDEPLNESNPIVKFSPIHYENSKAEAERRVLKANQDEGLDIIIVNPTAVFGPYDYQPSYLGQALIKIATNSLPMLVSGGYDFVDVRDVASGAIHAGLKGTAGEKYILSGNWYSLKDFSAMIAKVINQKTPGFVAPGFVARLGLPFITAYAAITGSHPLYTSESLDILKNSSRNISSEKAKKAFGYHTRPVEESLKDTFNWYRQNNLM